LPARRGGARTLAVLLEHQLALLVVLVLPAAPVLTALPCGAAAEEAEVSSLSRPAAGCARRDAAAPPPRQRARTHPCSSACLGAARAFGTQSATAAEEGRKEGVGVGSASACSLGPPPGAPSLAGVPGGACGDPKNVNF
jgi:hypothetical protein